jgi:hypothetical protein
VVNIRAISFGLSVVGFIQFSLCLKVFSWQLWGEKFIFYPAALSFVFMFLVPMGHATGDDGFIWRASRYLQIYSAVPHLFCMITLGELHWWLCGKNQSDFTVVVL